MNKKLVLLLGILFLVVIILYSCLNFYLDIEVKKEDVIISAKLEKNSSGHLEDYEYLLTVEMDKSKDCHIIIYPYIGKMADLSYLQDEDDKYYVASSMGSDGNTEAIAKKILKENLYISEGEDLDLIGFWFPDEKGTYQSRLFVDDLTQVGQPILIAVYYEEKYNKIFTWAKIIEVK